MKKKLTDTQPLIKTPSAGDTSFPANTSLSNGIPVYLIGGGSVDILRIEFIINAGQVTEHVPLSASVTNAMLTEGTEYHNAFDLNELIDRTGAVFNQSVEKEIAGLVIVTLPRKLDEVLSLAYEVLFHPSFPEEEFRMMIEKRIQTYMTGRKRTSVVAREQFFRALCGNDNPYGRVIDMDDYSFLSTSHLADFHRLHYRRDDMYITVAGQNPGQALPYLEKYFSAGNGMTWKKPELPVFNFMPPSATKIFAEVQGSVQSTIRVGWKGITASHPDYHPLKVATILLGGYFGSRLMRNIREEKGYTYGIHSVSGAFHDLGFITVITEVANNYREETIREITNEINLLAETAPGDDEMKIVRNHIMGETARMFDGPFAKAETLKTILDTAAGTEYYTEFTETVKSITPGKIKDLVNTYLIPEEAFVIIAGAK